VYGDNCTVERWRTNIHAIFRDIWNFYGISIFLLFHDFSRNSWQCCTEPRLGKTGLCLSSMVMWKKADIRSDFISWLVGWIGTGTSSDWVEAHWGDLASVSISYMRSVRSYCYGCWSCVYIKHLGLTACSWGHRVRQQLHCEENIVVFCVTRQVKVCLLLSDENNCFVCV
jgi:hypothetical protein